MEVLLLSIYGTNPSELFQLWEQFRVSNTSIEQSYVVVANQSCFNDGGA